MNSFVLVKSVTLFDNAPTNLDYPATNSSVTANVKTMLKVLIWNCLDLLKQNSHFLIEN